MNVYAQVLRKKGESPEASIHVGAHVLAKFLKADYNNASVIYFTSLRAFDTPAAIQEGVEQLKEQFKLGGIIKVIIV